MATFYDEIHKLTAKPLNLKREVETALGITKPKIVLPEAQVTALLDKIVPMKEYFMAVLGMGSDAEFNTMLLDQKKKLMNGTWCKNCKNFCRETNCFCRRCNL